MKDTLVSQELYDLLKEKGYDIPDKQNECPCDMLINRSSDYLGYVLPTLSMVQKWLRDKHDIHISINHKQDEPINKYELSVYIDDIYDIEKEIYATYESALEEGLKQGLTLIEI